MATEPKFYPLCWPEGIARSSRKAASQFRTAQSTALNNVEKSLEAFGRDSNSRVSNIVLSSNVGGLRTGEPEDSGVAAWFTWDGEQRCIAVDRYPKVADNLQAIHHIIEARRTEMRHGGLSIVRQTFRGFTALPAPPGSLPKPWWKILGLPNGDVSENDINAMHKRLAAQHHPDKGGSAEKMAEINRARDDGIRAAKDRG